MAGTPVMQATVSNSADAFNPSAKQKFLAETMNLPTSGTRFPLQRAVRFAPRIRFFCDLHPQGRKKSQPRGEAGFSRFTYS
ncbi:hypothetical protein GCM10023156_34820 [Novipirellula rosea]|uniref:Uncharacterized protein n=1 Tax=Novipirellula rosea TaxID=1031540 RepID=A0ABP8MZX7_9BACT